MLRGDTSRALPGDPVQPPPGSSLRDRDLGILPLRLEKALLGEPPEGLVQRPVRRECSRPLTVGQSLRELEPVERLAAARGYIEDGQLERDERSGLPAHAHSLAPQGEYDYIFLFMDVRVIRIALFALVGALFFAHWVITDPGYGESTTQSQWRYVLFFSVALLTLGVAWPVFGRMVGGHWVWRRGL